MIAGTAVIGASLLALLADRHLLGRVVGSTPFSKPATMIGRVLGITIPVCITLAIAATLAGAFSLLVMRPFGAAWLYPVVLVALTAFVPFALEPLGARWLPPDMCSRIANRTMVMAALLGLLTLAPEMATNESSVSWYDSVFDSLLAGAVFSFITLIWYGIHERIDLYSPERVKRSLVKDLLIASLIALVLTGIFSLPSLEILRIH